MSKEKTVYILGAGASKSAKLPLQAELLKKIFNLRPRVIDTSLSFMSLTINDEEQEILKYYDNFNQQRKLLAQFVVDNFSSQAKRTEYSAVAKDDPATLDAGVDKGNWMRAYEIASEVNVTLEDLFTLFDKITLGHEHFRVYSPQRIEEIHDALRKCIIFVLAYETAVNASSIGAYKTLAKILINDRLKASQKDDVLSIITMNWDFALEREIYRQCVEYNSRAKKIKIFPDLCFYDHSFISTESRIVSTHIKAKGNKNVKILKLHGSINWLVCPYCGRVYVDYKHCIAINEFLEHCACPYCLNEFKDINTSPRLHSMLITPTFLKDLNNLHIKNIWHNALIDLTEASKIVFIGYSFPNADFEMRCLLKKAVRPNTSIEVVLHSSDNPEMFKNKLKKHRFSKAHMKEFVSKLDLPEVRYISFFGDDMINFSYDGFESYLIDRVGRI